MKEIIYGKEVYTVSDAEISEIIDRRKAFVIYKDRFSMVKYLDQPQKAQILDIIYEYQIEGARELPEGLDQITEAVADQILKGFQLADDSYIKTSVINGINGRKGGRKPKESDRLPTEATASERKRSEADIDIDTDIDTDTEKKRKESPTSLEIKLYCISALHIQDKNIMDEYQSILKQKADRDGMPDNWKLFLDGVKKKRQQQGLDDERPEE